MALILALDTDAEHGRTVLGAVASHLSHVKLGHVLLSRTGIDQARLMVGTLPLFLDLKFHDIPATVARAIEGYADSFPTLDLFTIHGTGGDDMIRAAVEVAAERTLRVLAVSGLSSEAHAPATLLTRFERLIGLGVRAFVCPPPMVAAVRQRFGPDPLLVVPGIRAEAGDDQDHHLTATPQAARAAGADHLVVGRPILAAADPRAALAPYLKS